MHVLRGVHRNRTILIWEGTVPVFPQAAGPGQAQRYRLANAVQGIKHLYADVREICNGDHTSAVGRCDGMPGVEIRRGPYDTGIHMHRPHAFGPVHEAHFACAWDPGLVSEPFPRRPLKQATAAGTIPVHDPHTVLERTGVEEQVRIVRTKLHVRHVVQLEGLQPVSVSLCESLNLKESI